GFVAGGYAGRSGCWGLVYCYVPAFLIGLFAASCAEQLVCVVEVFEEFGEERVPVRDDGFLDAIEGAAVHSFRVVRGLQQIRRYRSGEDCLGYSFRSIVAYVARDLASSHRETDQREVI